MYLHDMLSLVIYNYKIQIPHLINGILSLMLERINKILHFCGIDLAFSIRKY